MLRNLWFEGMSCFYGRFYGALQPRQPANPHVMGGVKTVKNRVVRGNVMLGFLNI